MKFTVLGSTGFIGNALALHLKAKGYDVETPDRDIQSLAGKKLGHVVNAIGVTGNFREHPELAIEAHVNVLQRLLKDAHFDSWLYLSSTRIYRNAESTQETSSLSITPNSDTLYDLSKLLGESICLSHNNPAVRIARLSNVYGTNQSHHTFLGSILQDLKDTRKSTIHETPDSSKDYISINSVCKLLESISVTGKERIYNVASGKAVTHSALADVIRASNYTIDFAPLGTVRISPQINTDRILNEFMMNSSSIIDDLPHLLKQL